jgi:hypothetical protein
MPTEIRQAVPQPVDSGTVATKPATRCRRRLSREWRPIADRTAHAMLTAALLRSGHPLGLKFSMAELAAALGFRIIEGDLGGALGFTIPVVTVDLKALPPRGRDRVWIAPGQTDEERAFTGLHELAHQFQDLAGLDSWAPGAEQFADAVAECLQSPATYRRWARNPWGN